MSFVLNRKGFKEGKWWMSQRKSESVQEGMKDGESRHGVTFWLSVREESTRQSGNQKTLNPSVRLDPGCKAAHINKPLILTTFLPAPR